MRCHHVVASVGQVNELRVFEQEHSVAPECRLLTNRARITRDHTHCCVPPD
jgi:hypothetical protein